MEAHPIRIAADVCRDYGRSSRLEWLETNGTGAFAMGTVSGANARRYHGALVASLFPPVNRVMMLSRLEDQAVLPDGVHELGCNQYPGVVHPRGFELLQEFRLDPFPVWTWRIGEAEIQKDLFLIPDRQAVVVRYRANRKCVLRARPFVAFRDYHSLTHANDAFSRAVEQGTNFIRMQPYNGMPSLTLNHSGANHSGARFEADGMWFYNFEYLIDQERGLDFHEDLYTPGALVFDLDPGREAWIAADVDDTRTYGDEAIGDAFHVRLAARPEPAPTVFITRLREAAAQFRATRADGTPTVIAGYPWFTDWGRDTMISLPGLFIAPGLLDEARRAMQAFLAHRQHGLIPNRFGDQGDAQYNTCDATLWLFQAAWSFGEAGGARKWLGETFYPAAKEIISWHERGTLFNIRVDPEDGLLSAGADDVQLTWMDAKVGDWVVTPRRGKPVEVNALWANALRIAESLAKEFGDSDGAEKFGGMSSRAEASFAAKFWNAEQNCLYDVLGPEGPDASIRPNQVFAVSLPFPLLDEEKRKAVMRVVEEKLLTPVGLRTLAPEDPKYKGRYDGTRDERDAAYHQGTTWPWLLGPFVTAWLNVFGRTPENLDHCRKLIAPMERQMYVFGLGTINEIYDGDAPYYPHGCVAQAWSVAELLRVIQAELKGEI